MSEESSEFDEQLRTEKIFKCKILNEKLNGLTGHIKKEGINIVIKIPIAMNLKKFISIYTDKK